MRIELKLNQKLDLQLRLAPQIIQSIELLQLPSIDLVDAIQQELDTNEFLEVKDEAPAEETPPKEVDEAKAEEERSRDEEVAVLERLEIWDDPETRRPRVRDDETLNAKMEAMQNTASVGPSLQDSLIEQWHLLDRPPELLPLAEQVIYNIDDNGYLAYPLEEVLEPLSDRFTLEEAEGVLEYIQRLEPKGVGARNRAECLVLQLDPTDERYDEKKELLEGHLEDLLHNRLPKVARALKMEMEDLKELLHELSDLNLRPGAQRLSDRNHYISPDLILEWDGHEYEVRLANEYIPELRLSPRYRDVLMRDDVPKDYREYVKKKIDSARAFIMAVEKRQKTLLDVARLIVRHQRDYFDFGPHYLKPLKMQDVADELGVHVSTISRATSSKYIQTHRGIFSLKSFFSGGTASASGAMQSRESVKQKMKELVEHEDKQAPLSDDEIVERMRSHHGLKVARRTVTKYRKALGIPSSRQRREY